MGYQTVKYGKKASRRNYSKMRYDIDLPNLIEIQTSSFSEFVEQDIKELLDDISPIEGHNGDLRLYFENPYIEDSKFSVADAKLHDITYSKQLYATVKLENTLTNEIRESRIFMCDLPYMTSTGTFIVNGAERVVVSQIIRSAGSYYTSELDKKTNKIKYSGQVIPTRGAWIEYELGARDIFYTKVDRSRKVPLTTLMRALGLSSEQEIYNLFGKSDHMQATMQKDETKNSDEAVVEIYARLRQDERVPAAAAREFIRMRLFEKRRYDLAPVGRYQFNKKLDVLTRVAGKISAKNIIDKETKEIIIKRGEIFTKEKIAQLSETRESFRIEVISKEQNLQNETPDEILALPVDGSELLYTTEPIVDLKTGAIIVEEGTEVTPELIITLRKNRIALDEKVIKFFLHTDPYDRALLRGGVLVELIEVLVPEQNVNIDDVTIDQMQMIPIIGNDQRENRIHVTVSDIVASISYYLNLYEGVGTTDDIDHLGNRRLRLIGELLKNQFRIGLARTEKNIKDKMSITSSSTNFADIMLLKIVNTKPLAGAIQTFFGSSQLSQFMDQINPLAELTQKRRVSALGTGGIARDRAGVEVRDVHNSHYGRICPIETPEGPSIGLISSLATYSKVNQYGFIQTPYLVVNRTIEKNGAIYPVVTSDFKYLTADEEAKEIIASAASPLTADGSFAEEKVIGRSNGEAGLFDGKDVTYMDVSPKQIVSVATSTIPFLEHDDASRALMGANMQRQAVPLVVTESPIVGTGIEYRAAKDSGSVVVCERNGIVIQVDAQKIVVMTTPDDITRMGGDTGKIVFDPGSEAFTLEKATILATYGLDAGLTKTYPLTTFARSNQDTCILQKPIVKLGELVEAGDVIADGPSTDKGELALGRNVTVAFMTWEGYNYEDAIIMSEDLVKHDVYTSIHIDEYEVETRDLRTGSGKEEITREIPNAGPEALKNLDEKGIVVAGTEVKEGDILVGKITPKGVNEPTPSERLIYAIIGEKSRDYRDSSLRVPHGSGGIVQKIEYLSREKGDILANGVNETVRVYIAKKRKITEGDKMAGRHGNKGVISKILPREDMPYMEDGTPIDIMLNPLGVPSRMNIGQVLEIHLGAAAKNLNIKVASPVFDGVEDQDLRNIMKEAGLDEDGKTVLYDGRTGEKYENRISVGIMYMIKLDHMVDDKLHARSVGPYTLVTQQPMGGKAQNGGQRFGEMEVWALYAYGASHTLQEMLTIKSDDMIGRNRVYSSITHSKPIPESSIPESFRVLTRELQALGLYVELIDAKTGENEAIKSLVTAGRRRGGYNQ